MYWKCLQKNAIYLVIHVSDLSIPSKDIQLLEQEKPIFGTKFDMHDLEEAKH